MVGYVHREYPETREIWRGHQSWCHKLSETPVMLKFPPGNFYITREMLKLHLWNRLTWPKAREILKVYRPWCHKRPKTPVMLKFPPGNFNITREMLKLHLQNSLTWPKTREMLNKLNRLKLSPDYRHIWPIVGGKL